jgi:hypothetical protein
MSKAAVVGSVREKAEVVTPPKNPHPADGPKRQRRAPIPAQGKALGTDRATAQGLKARPIPILAFNPQTVSSLIDPLPAGVSP